MAAKMSKPKLPKTDSIEELSQFWDNHDVTHFEDELEEVEEPIFELHSRSVTAKEKQVGPGFHTMSHSTRKAFVIGPIGDKYAEPGTRERLTWEEAVRVFEEIITPALKANGLEAVRADMITRTGEITEQIFRQLRDSELVIADLTGANPNVMYELGLRHTTGKLTLQIGEKGRLPFDVAAIRTILFRRSETGFITAQSELRQAIKLALAEGGDPVTSTRIWHEQSIPSIEANGADTSGADDTLSLDTLSEIFDHLTRGLNVINAITDEITSIMGDGTTALRQINERGAQPSDIDYVTELAAGRLKEPASRMEVAVGDFSNSLERLAPGMEKLIHLIKEDPETYSGIRSTFIGTADSINEARAAAVRFRDSMKDLGELSGALSKVGNRIGLTLQRFVDITGQVQVWKMSLAGIGRKGN